MDKQALREQVKTAVAAMKPGRRAIEEDVVAAAIQGEPAWQSARVVALYKATKEELTAVSLTNAAWRAGKTTVFPRVDGEDLSWHAVGSWRGLRPGRWGIEEPVGPPATQEVAAADVDLWIVPGVAFAADGGRLGRGKGYYDRALQARKEGSLVWGMAFDAQVLEAVPREAHDIHMDKVFSARLCGIDLD